MVKMLIYLARRFNSFPNAEVNNDPSEQKTHGEFKAYFTCCPNTTRYFKHLFAEIEDRKRYKRASIS